MFNPIVAALIALLLFACGAPVDDEELGQTSQEWATRQSAVGGRTWGAREEFGNPACTLTQSNSAQCFFHGTANASAGDNIIKWWPHTEWFNSEDAMIASLIDTFISNANGFLGNGQSAMPWSFQRLVGNTEPSGTNVVIRNKVIPAGEALTTNVGQYVSVDWDNPGNCVFNLIDPNGALDEPTPLNGQYRNCIRATIYFALNDLETYMAQQGYSETAKTDTRRHVLWHAMFAELGLGGTNTSTNSATRVTFSKTNRITQVLSSEELCRWRNVNNTQSTFQFIVTNNTCS